MKRKLRNAVLVCGAVLGLLVLVYPLLSSMAQKSQNQKNPKTQEQENALQVIRQNVVANNFYNTLQSQETDWTLTKASYYPGGLSADKRDGQNIYLVLKKDRSEVQVLITEYNSARDATFPFKIQISQGIIENCKNEECGDEGQKIYEGFNDKGVNVGFVSLRFRKGRFFVSIHCKSEEASKRFAGYAINAIANG